MARKMELADPAKKGEAQDIDAVVASKSLDEWKVRYYRIILFSLYFSWEIFSAPRGRVS